MNRIHPDYPTALQMSRAMEQGRAERARAFHAGLKAIGSFFSGGTPQDRH